MWHIPVTEPLPDQTCRLCGARSRLIAAHLGVCLDCIRQRPQEALPVAAAAHVAARRLLAKRGTVVCWETNGTAHPRLMKSATATCFRTTTEQPSQGCRDLTR